MIQLQLSQYGSPGLGLFIGKSEDTSTLGSQTWLSGSRSENHTREGIGDIKIGGLMGSKRREKTTRIQKYTVVYFLVYAGYSRE